MRRLDGEGRWRLADASATEGRPDADLSPRELTERYHRQAVAAGCRWAHRFNRDRDDLVQAACLGLLRAAHQWKDIGVSFSTYARRSIAGHIIDELGWQRRTPDNIEDIEAAERIEAPEHEDDGRLDGAMAALPEREREAVIRLVAYEETQTDAGLAMGLHRETVRKAAAAGLAKLRVALAG